MRLTSIRPTLPTLPTLPAPSLRRLARLPGRRGDALRRRLAVLLAALEGPEARSLQGTDAVDALIRRLEEPEPDEVWLTIAVLTAELPEAPVVARGVRACRMSGPSSFLDGLVAGNILGDVLGSGDTPDVEVVSGEVLVDLEHTRRTELATGIQRVSRMAARRWARDHRVVLVGWTGDLRALRRLTPAEQARALHGRSEDQSATDERTVVVVPWRATYLLPELALERERTLRMLALARYARSRTGVVGHDCVPISSAETTDVGVSEGFSNYLAAVRHMDVVSSVSEASAGEYRGWRRMLAAIGVQGPEVTAVPLPAEAHEPSAEALQTARDRLLVASLPMVLCVGTHEPRKNHLAVLHAAEVLWRRGLRFSLTFVGGHSWNSQRFDEGLAQLRAAGRPVDNLSGVSDDELWAAYRVSHCVVFPSLNEGFGLPVAEALACGTPVVTSAFGSMAEIAAGGGAVLVDPRDDASLVDGLQRVLTDREEYAALRAAAAARPSRTWDQYAEETWALLTGGGAP